MTFREFYNMVLAADYPSNDQIPFSLTPVLFKKGEVITDYEQIEKKVYFINEGIVELTIKSYMTEKVIDFFVDHEMVSALTSFLTQTPSDVRLTALTDCTMEMVHHHELMKAYEEGLDINKFSRIITEQAYIRKSNREKDFLCLTAEERYEKMFNTHHKYLNSIPVNKVARYLGIHPESLSRIRAKLNS